MKVKVKLFALARRYDCPPTMELKIKKGEKVSDILKRLNVPSEVANVVLINGFSKSKEAELKEGDVVSIFPLLIGG